MQPASKRPKVRQRTLSIASEASAKIKTSLDNVRLQDFCSALLRDRELNERLHKHIRIRNKLPSSSENDPYELPRVPLSFNDVDHYSSTFYAMLVDETKASIFPDLNCSLRRIGFSLTCRSSEQSASENIVQCRIRAALGQSDSRGIDWRARESEFITRHISDLKNAPVGLSQLQRGDLLILLHKHMLLRNEEYYETDSALIAFGIVSRPARPEGSGEKGGRSGAGAEARGLEFDILVEPSVAARLQNVPMVAYVMNDCNLVTFWREWDGLNALLSANDKQRRSLIPTLLNGGSEKSQEGERSASPVSDLFSPGNVAEFSVSSAIVHPGATPVYQDFLNQNYNRSQIQAIAAACKADSGFVLVQGPPGTGKTHTLLALLNSLHLSVSQQCYEMDLPNPNRPDNPIHENVRFDWFRDRTNPHLLIAAPSNAAVDNVLRLVLTKGFVDGTGRRYVPKCVRVGSSNWNTARNNSADIVGQASLDAQVDALMRMGANAKSDSRTMGETDALSKRLRGVEAEVRRLGRVLAEVANEHAKTKDPNKLNDFHALAGQWVDHRNRARDLALELERRRLFFSQAGSVGDAAIRADLRALVVTQANLVFATLSQCGSPTMIDIAPARVKFQVCVVDEAAQAVEPSTLIPFSLGVERYVMVGDPNQLPATVLSERATRARYQQSLFERLQRSGHAVHLLDTQYRCRPEISEFCSRTFYGGKLKDGPNVLAPSYKLDAYRFPCFGPLVFFDVAYGAQVRRASTQSLYNEAEANMCLALYKTLRSGRVSPDTISPVTKKPCQIAVITPYREQYALLQRQFSESLKEDPLLELGTVDGFQGREVDVVIFSCVRAHGASSGSVSKKNASSSVSSASEVSRTPSPETTVEEDTHGIGFLNDARRLNVAETRARFSLLMVGNIQILRNGSRMWRGLLDHCRTHGRIISVPQSDMDVLALG